MQHTEKLTSLASMFIDSWPKFAQVIKGSGTLSIQKCPYTLPEKRCNFKLQLFYGDPGQGSVTPGHNGTIMTFFGWLSVITMTGSQIFS